MDVAHHKPTEGSSLYKFYFEHLAKINKLKVNFSESDKICLIIGAIGDEHNKFNKIIFLNEHSHTAFIDFGSDCSLIEDLLLEVFFGYKLRVDGDKYIDDNDMDIIDVTSLRKDVAKRLEENRIKQNNEFNKKRCSPVKYAVGDLVLTKITSFPANNESKKLLEKYRGPFRIIEVLPNDRYRVKEDVHSSRNRRPYEGVVGSLVDDSADMAAASALSLLGLPTWEDK
ncbi:uncharacterized protein [Diabrotica undecimpunctata]|uniref:uncharacterized protein n=1 Tax=Diabrotica undecimpunctata TaxID=50387 RepID=UPI003B634AC8